MLWEAADPAAALSERFGFTSAADAEEWIASTLAERWRLPVASCERILISDRNAIVWVRGGSRSLVVKIAANPTAFARLAGVADLLTAVSAVGIATPTPVLTTEGASRAVVVGRDRDLSVLVQPEVEGDLLDVDDLDAVRASGVELARLHSALADLPPGPLHVPGRGADAPLRERWAALLGRSTGEPARRRLAALLDSLPDIDREPQLTHGDIRSANVLTRDHRVAALLDFDEVGLDHRVAELGRAAVLLATRFRDWGPTPPPAQHALIDGYRSVIDLSPAEQGWLQAAVLATSLAMIPPGPDPTGWSTAATRAAL